jgi:hypothetical protein
MTASQRGLGNSSQLFSICFHDFMMLFYVWSKKYLESLGWKAFSGIDGLLLRVTWLCYEYGCSTCHDLMNLVKMYMTMRCL